ncbi:hypothetical protein EON77_19650 [bacterium]|nr:MAG: hypothetical protein EON77_19650 [bacterium]
MNESEATGARALRSWAGSLSPAWQAVVPGAFAWAVTIVRPAAASVSKIPLGCAVVALVGLLLGPLLEPRLESDHGRLISFWIFVLGSLAALATTGVPGPIEAPEAIVGVLSWVFFAVTVAAPALGPEARGVSGRPDRTLAPRRTQVRRVWPYFAVAILASVTVFACALGEPNRERATAFTLLAPLGSLVVFAALGNQVRFGKGKQRLRVPVVSLLLALVALGLASYVAWRTWRKSTAAEAHASSILRPWRCLPPSSTCFSPSEPSRSVQGSRVCAGMPTPRVDSSCSRVS